MQKIGKWLWIAVAVLCAVWLGKLLYDSSHGLTVTRYTLSTPKLTESVRVVHLTDLHNSTFGQDNERLISLVGQQEPDLILMTGDMLNEHEPDTRIAGHLVERMSAIAPIYFSYGNHEKGHERQFDADLGTLFAGAGAAVLEKTYCDVDIKGQKLRIGGMYGYALPQRYLLTGEAKESECRFLAEFEQTERFTLLLTHMPNCWILNENLDVWQVDSVFCGHTHGGHPSLCRRGVCAGLWLFPGKAERIIYVQGWAQDYGALPGAWDFGTRAADE